jgi:hypothetical protein
MKNFTAIYDTYKIKNVEYNFNALDIENAYKLAKHKFEMEKVKNFRIVQEISVGLKVAYEKPKNEFKIGFVKEIKGNKALINSYWYNIDNLHIVEL